jgi:hypothetical protein
MGADKKEIDRSDDMRKFKAIELLVRKGRRGSEWQEAGLLNSIEKIINGHPTGVNDMEKLLREAAEY